MFVCGIFYYKLYNFNQKGGFWKDWTWTPPPPSQCLKFEIILGNPKHKTTPDGYQQVNPSPNNNIILIFHYVLQNVKMYRTTWIPGTQKHHRSKSLKLCKHQYNVYIPNFKIILNSIIWPKVKKLLLKFNWNDPGRRYVAWNTQT